MEIWSVFISIAFGALGYLTITFIIQPILKYYDIKTKLISDLIFYTNVVEADQNKMQESEIFRNMVYRRIEAMRRHASDLEAITRTLPFFYKTLLRCKKENPTKAASELIKLANTSNMIEGMIYMENINTYLKINLF